MLAAEWMGPQSVNAGDTAPVDTAPVDTAPVDTAPVDTAPVDTAPVDTASLDTSPLDTSPLDTSAALIATTTPEGEPAPDLVQFAKDLAAAGVTLFGAAWHATTTDQVQMFDDGWDDLPFVEVTGPDRELNAEGIIESITNFPTWDFPTGPRVEGLLSLAEISSRSGVDIPMGEAPSFAEIPDQVVLIGAPLHIPIDAYDPNGGPLTVSVSIENTNAVEATVLQGNRSIRIDMEGFGDMVFELFEQRAPVPAGRVADLAEAGFYDGLTYHRIIDDFVLQTGDPTGTGTSGSELGFFDDQFHPELQHNRSGILSFAKSTDDANNSQFFITEVPTRHLDFNHSIFGQLVEGEDVREAISEVQTYGPEVDAPDPTPSNPFPVDPDPDHMKDQPVFDVIMTSIDVFTDTENSVIMLKAISDDPVSTSVTVTVTDSTGQSYSQTFNVELEHDTANGQPYLTEIEVPSQIYENETIEIQLDSIDVERDPVVYFASRIDGGDISGTLDQDTGLLTITPPPGDTGEMRLAVAVSPAPGSNQIFDRQIFTINIVARPLYHRLDLPTDVDGLNETTARDALLIINAMGAHGGEIDLTGGLVDGLNPEFAYNVNGDQRITALDALIVINALARAESEQVAPPSLELSASQIDLAFSSRPLALPAPTDRDDDDRDDLVQWLSQYDLGLQTFG